MSILAIIPARGGSKSIKRKNLRPVGSISLIGRAIRCALDSGVMDHVLVSTDNEEIRREALKYDAKVPFLRPKHLADDCAGTEDTLVHAIETFERHIGTHVSVIVLTEPTNPFRNPIKLRKAVELFETGKYGSIISVCPLERVPQNIFEKKDDILTRFIKEPKAIIKRRQNMTHLCRLSSVVYVFGRDDFLKNRALHQSAV